MKHLYIFRILIIFLLISSSVYSQISSELYWKPFDFLPIKIGYDGEKLSLSYESSISTPLGVFGTTASYKRKLSHTRKITQKNKTINERIVYAPEKDFVLILRKGGNDYVYTIQGYEEIVFTTTGQTTFKVGKHKLFVDLTYANVNNVKFKGRKYHQDNDIELNGLQETSKKITGVFIDNNDGQKYKWVKIGNQVWMAENLNLDIGNGCGCYDNNSINCNKYGKLYTWEAAKRVAAKIPGWHLPSNEDFLQLEYYLGLSPDDIQETGGYSENNVGDKLKSTYGWDHGGNGNNSSGFNALPAGHRINGGILFGGQGYSADFWTSDWYDNYWKYLRSLSSFNSSIHEGNSSCKGCGKSVRLVKD